MNYHGRHRPGGPDYGAPMHDVESMMPDYYTRPDLYRTYGQADAQSEQAILASRGRPDSMVWAYRAIPSDAPGGIRPGDWVTTSRAYAREHGESVLDGDYKITSMRVPAGTLWSEGNSIHEWGYHP